MKIKRLYILAFFFSSFVVANAQNDSLNIRSIVNQTLSNSVCYSRLDYLSNSIGGRLSGSPQAEQAVVWAQKTLKEDGFDSVWLQEVIVPHWVRGAKEEGFFTGKSGKTKVAICALGGSVGTNQKFISGNVVEVKDFNQLKNLGEAIIKGKIVFFNRPMDPLFIETFDAYSHAVDQRSMGAIEAAKLGAIAVLVRSMGSNVDKNPHTGAMRYLDGVSKIPACAISTYDAELLSGKLKQDNQTTFSLKMSCETLPDVISYNVVAQILGSEKPDEIILVGGHLDSWDNGDGSHDDGAGCVQSMEVLHTFKTLGIRPKRTIRCVLFMNEENGLKGGLKYAELAKANFEKHIAAIETDAGGFTPRKFSTTASDSSLFAMQKWEPLLKQYGIEEISQGHGGADIGPLKNQGVVLIGFGPDSQRYFDIHHTAVDTFDKVSKRELELGAANIAALVWLISEYGL
ncbi:MAG: M20/M25/M40 family metallo-hydrolase [Bacteroidia bacterium]|nr:M20/M25/M40 family metallo-hydrolase [Bacteroidia bacterium]MCF8426330.1 M20/M25/M40 family metallo-hydrolase [Bacteroidia bacterium]MCF8445771.1 M20/M25/M40 family metallo-hydrolase [Bacteroidia bacterium]